VQKFNKCALSVNGCVPRRIDSVMEWPVGRGSIGYRVWDLGAASSRFQIRFGTQNQDPVQAQVRSSTLSRALLTAWLKGPLLNFLCTPEPDGCLSQLPRFAGAARQCAGRAVRPQQVPGALVHHRGPEPAVRHLPLPGALLWGAQRRWATEPKRSCLSCSNAHSERCVCMYEGAAVLPPSVRGQAVWKHQLARSQG
jgi:hypothetical protein